MLCGRPRGARRQGKEGCRQQGGARTSACTARGAAVLDVIQRARPAGMAMERLAAPGPTPTDTKAVLRGIPLRPGKQWGH